MEFVRYVARRSAIVLISQNSF